MNPLLIFQIAVLALLQGATELFPVSSLGHTVIIPGLVGWGNLLTQPTFIPLVVTLHLGTSAALLIYFWRDWADLLKGGLVALRSGKLVNPREDPKGNGRQLALMVVGTIPTGLVGLFLQKPLESLFSAPILASAFLVANGAVLLVGERQWRNRVRQADIEMKTRGRSERLPGEQGLAINDVSFGQAAIIGFAQSFALLPGISRSGTTMVAGMANGLSREASARFSFLLATPIILLAGLAEVPKLAGAGKQMLLLAAGGGVLAGITAYLSVRYLMRYFETNRLDRFAFYCVGAGLLAFVFFFVQQTIGWHTILNHL
jgi:undecaprenyl-diphosphatase